MIMVIGLLYIVPSIELELKKEIEIGRTETTDSSRWHIHDHVSFTSTFVTHTAGQMIYFNDLIASALATAVHATRASANRSLTSNTP
jgi:hypothetical protein